VSNELVIDVNSSEINIALLEDKQLVELSKERSNKQFSVGDIYIGRVKKIMPGLNAAFVDVGYERDAFLHYLDLGPQYQTLNNYVQLALSLRKQQNDRQRALRNKNKIQPLETIDAKILPAVADTEIGLDIDKNGKIDTVLKSGQTIVVQIAKEPISSKGPRLTCEISLAGRNLVLIPFSDKISISQKIKSLDERNRLKRLIQSIKPKNYGVIVRTAAKSRKVAVLDLELRELVEKWEESFQNLSEITPPALVIGELDRTSALLRDILNATFGNINVNDLALYNEIRNFISTIAPEKVKIVKHYQGGVPIFDYFGINKQIKSLFGKTVHLKNGAYLIIEHTEALHVIDVNSGNRSTADNDQETNALDVNLSAANEIARQLRLRDMGGIIVVDFIDMHEPENRQKVYEQMKEAMAKDRTKHNILPLSKFGLMQITRQRVRPEMNIQTIETCPTCNGSGEVAPTVLFIDQLENNIKYLLRFSKARLTLKVHPFIAAYLQCGLISIKLKWWFRFKSYIKIKPTSTYNFLEYHFFDQYDEEIML